MARRHRREVRFAAFGTTALLVMLLLGGPLSRAVEAVRMWADVVAAGSSRIDGLPGSPPGEPVTYERGGHQRFGDLYRPEGVPSGAVVLVPGAAAEGSTHPALVAFAQGLARAGFAVLVPDLPNLRMLHVRASDAVAIADAVRFLAEGAGRGHAVGLVAISYSVGPAILAALDPGIAGRVGFVLAIGGYYDSEAMVTFLLTGHRRDPETGAWQPAQVHPYGRWVLGRSDAALVPDETDRQLLSAIADRRWLDPNAPIDDLEPHLGPGGRAVLALMRNRDPARVPALLAALPEPVRRNLDGLNLRHHDLSALQGRLIVVHGRDDTIVPYTQSLALAAAGPPGRTELFVLDNMTHVQLGPGGVRDALALWQAIYAVLAARDAAPERGWQPAAAP